MYATVTNYVRGLTSSQYSALCGMFSAANNLYNVGMYHARQYYFANNTFPTYEDIWKTCKGNENYHLLPAQASQQILKEAHEAVKGFKKLTAKATNGAYDPKKVRLPGYKEKGGMSGFSVPAKNLRISNGKIKVPISRFIPKKPKEDTNIWIPYPKVLEGKKLCEIRLYPCGGAKAIKIAYTYEVIPDDRPFPSEAVMGIDLGVDNFASCVTTTGTSFLIDGRGMKSINQWYNKEMARLKSEAASCGITSLTNREFRLLNRRNNQINDIIYKSAKYIMNFCLKEKIGTVVVGHNPGIKQRVNMNSVNNQHFCFIPHSKFRSQLKFLCEKNGLIYLEQEESYTSLSSFLDNDPLPVHGKEKGEIHFSGRRVTRGAYRTRDGTMVNADINAAANIIRKSMRGVLPGDGIDKLTSGVMLTPSKIRVVTRKWKPRIKRERYHSRKGKCASSSNDPVTSTF